MDDLRQTEEIEEERLSRLNQSRLRSDNLSAEVVQTKEAFIKKLEAVINKHRRNKKYFALAFALAAFKELVLDIALDFAFGFGLIPIIGQIPGWATSFAIFILMFGKGMFVGKAKARSIVFLLGDSVPYLEELPLTVISIFFVWSSSSKKAKLAQRYTHKVESVSVEKFQEIEKKYKEIEKSLK